ncbi:unnamed protein product [Auanema sp. JU1783]|nr:unnamed protein product [Auanema sp. JU1783]
MSLEALRLKNLGNDAFKNKLYNQAVKLYTESLLLEQDSVVFSNRAQAHINLKQWEMALMDSNAAVKLDGACAKSYYRRATAYDNMGFRPLALCDAKKALTLSSDPAIQNLYKKIEAKKFSEITFGRPCEMGDELRSDFLKTIHIELEPTEKKDSLELDKAVDNSFCYDILEVPKTVDSFAKFLADYESLKKHTTRLAEYFLHIPLERYTILFDDLMEIQIFSDLLKGFVHLLTTENSKHVYDQSVASCLKTLHSVDRFDMVIMFMSVEDNKNLKTICDQLSPEFREDILQLFTQKL